MEYNIIVGNSIKTFSNDDLVKLLVAWCDNKRGRSARLSELVWPNRNKNAQSVALAPIKQKKKVPSKDTWQLIIDSMVKVESNETKVPAKRTKKIKSFVTPNIKIKIKAKAEVKDEVTLLTDEDKKEFINFAYHGFDPTKVTDEMIFSNRQAFKDNLYHFNAHRHDKSVKSQLYIIKQWLKEDTKCKIKLANVTYMMNFDRDESNGFSKLINNIMTDDDFIRAAKIMSKVNQLIEYNSPFALAARRSA